jgi:predicted nucleic acid-binding protein
VNASVVDASVAAKWVLPSAQEKLVSEAVHLLDLNARGETELVVPDLFWAESGNILWKAVRNGRCSRAVAVNGLATLKAHNLITVASAGLLEQAFMIAVAFNCSVYDSLYLALAVEFGVQLVTADEKLVNAVTGHFPVKWLGAL